MIPTPFRMTSEDLEGVDGKVKAAVGPILESLNLTLGDVSSILTGNVGSDNLDEEIKTIKLSIDTVAGSFPLKFKTKVVQPRVVVMANCVPSDPAHSLTTPFVMQGYGLTDFGLVSIPAITGLLASNSYTLTFWVR